MTADEVSLSKLAESIEQVGSRNGWDRNLVTRVNLVLEELVLNVRDYGQVDGRRFDVSFDSSSPDRLLIEFVDDGVPFDPTLDAPEPDLISGLDDRHAGGLGVHMVMSLVDSLEYAYSGGRNCLFILVARVGVC